MRLLLLLCLLVSTGALAPAAEAVTNSEFAGLLESRKLMEAVPAMKSSGGQTRPTGPWRKEALAGHRAKSS